MRSPSLLGVFTAFLLATLLAGTTPHGTGAGAHRLQLLHPLLPHEHVDGNHGHRADARAPVYEDHQEHPAFSVGTGATPAAWGIGVTPLAQTAVWLETSPWRTWRHPALELLRPAGRTERPPVPPPTPAA